jgi:multidrug resistance efflux pump
MIKKRDLDKLDLRSEEVQEILTTPPSWIVRWGLLLIFKLTVFLLTLSFIIKYPDFISAKILITTLYPTEHVVARFTGPLERIFIKDKEQVSRGQNLAMIKNTAIYEDVYLLKSILDTISIKQISSFPFSLTSNMVLGDVNAAYISFEKNYTDYFLLKNLEPYSNQLGGDRVALSEIKNRLNSQMSQKTLLQKEEVLKRNDLERYKMLYDKGVVSQQDYEQKQLEFIRHQKSINALAITISQMREAIASANRNLRKTMINEEEDVTRYLSNLNQSFELLKDAIREWEYNYMLKSSIDGTISFQDFWGENQFVSAGSIIFSILPLDSSDLVGKLILPSHNAGKVAIGQKVFIKLDNYPYQQYGVLIGEVLSVSISPNDKNQYTVFVSLPNGTTTSYSKPLKFTQELLGKAEVITEHLSVAERLFYKFREVLTYN